MGRYAGPHSAGRPGNDASSIRICDLARGFALPIGPWQALRDRFDARRTRKSPPRRTLDPPAGETSARACFQWGFLLELEGRDQETIAWLGRATRPEPSDFWCQFYVGYYHERAGHPQRALEHYQSAVVQRPHSSWARYNRARPYSARGDWDPSLDDLNQAVASARDPYFLEAHFELGVVKQFLGDAAGAREGYESVIASDRGGPLAGAGRLNRAKLDVDAGAIGRARAEYDALLAEDPRERRRWAGVLDPNQSLASPTAGRNNTTVRAMTSVIPIPETTCAGRAFPVRPTSVGPEFNFSTLDRLKSVLPSRIRSVHEIPGFRMRSHDDPMR